MVLLSSGGLHHLMREKLVAGHWLNLCKSLNKELTGDLINDITRHVCSAMMSNHANLCPPPFLSPSSRLLKGISTPITPHVPNHAVLS